MRICTLCNGLQPITTRCSECGGRMIDGGPVSDYFGPYSPYVSRDSLNSRICCVHLLYCSECGADIRECGPESEI